MAHATMLGVSSRALIQACERLGVDPRPALAASGIERSELDDPDRRFPASRIVALWRAALAASGTAEIGLLAAEALPFGAYAVVDLLCRSSATVGEGFTRISRCFPIINTGVELPVAVGRDTVTLGMVTRRDPEGMLPAYVEYALAAVFLRTRVASGIAFRLTRVDFAHCAPPDVRNYRRIFDCPVRFGAAKSQLVIPRASWDAPISRADPTLATVLDQHARALLAELPRSGDVSEAVRADLLRELADGEPTLGRIAHRLGLSPRALQRQLAEDGIRFDRLLGEVRSAVARTQLGWSALSIGEIAHLLGFAEQSSFSRAFRKWTGTSPLAFRAAAARAAAPTTGRTRGSESTTSTRPVRSPSPRRARPRRTTGSAAGT